MALRDPPASSFTSSPTPNISHHHHHCLPQRRPARHSLNLQWPRRLFHRQHLCLHGEALPQVTLPPYVLPHPTRTAVSTTSLYHWLTLPALPPTILYRAVLRIDHPSKDPTRSSIDCCRPRLDGDAYTVHVVLNRSQTLGTLSALPSSSSRSIPAKVFPIIFSERHCTILSASRKQPASMSRRILSPISVRRSSSSAKKKRNVLPCFVCCGSCRHGRGVSLRSLSRACCNI